MKHWVAGFVFLAVIFSWAAAVMVNQYFPDTAIDRVQTLITGPTFTSVTNPLGYVSTFMSWGWDWVSNLVGMATFSYPNVFHDEYQIFRYILCIPLGVGLIAGAVSVFAGSGE